MNDTSRLVEDEEGGADLAGLFATTMADLETRPRVMVDDAVRRGRPRRRVRVLASVAGGAAAVALLGGLGSYAVGGLSASPGQPVVAGGPSTAVVTPNVVTPMRTPTPTPKASTRANPAEGQEARVSALYLTRLAPDGAVAGYRGQQGAGEVFVGSQIDLGEGKVGLELNLQANFLGAPEPSARAETATFYSCRRGASVGAGYGNCQVARNDDGSILMTYTEAVPEGSASRARAVVADYLRSDGTRVLVRSGNVPDLKYGGKPRRGPTIAQARRIAIDPVWAADHIPTAEDVAEAQRVIKPWKLLPG